MQRLRVIDTPLAGVRLVEREPRVDPRGFLSRIFCASELLEAGWSKPIAQINQSHTAQGGTVRGLHYQQAPDSDMKLVSCLRGAVWDVVVDLRAQSSTYLQWYGCELSAVNYRALLIPEGCAHGFQSLQDDTELLYCHSAAYAAQSDAGLHPQDPQLAIAWPLPVTLLSTRDAALPGLHGWTPGDRA